MGQTFIGYHFMFVEHRMKVTVPSLKELALRHERVDIMHAYGALLLCTAPM